MAFYANMFGNPNGGLYGGSVEGEPYFGNNPYGGSQGSLYVDPFVSGDQGAQETLARLYEAEFEDYLQRFFPVEQDLIQQMTTGFGGLQQEEIARAQKAVARQYANVAGQQQRRLAGYGLRTPMGTQQEMQRSETSALVAARNFARMRSEERRMQVLSGGLGSGISERTVTQQGGLGG